MLGFFCWREFENNQHLPLGVSIEDVGLCPKEKPLLSPVSCLTPCWRRCWTRRKMLGGKRRGLVNKLKYSFFS
jgi:hypothetical protein